MRTVPRSRHNPQFNADALAASLADAGVAYCGMPALAAFATRRRTRPTRGWRNASFRGYADYMQTEAFAGGSTDWSALGRQRPTAIMCAEAVPWRCHRSLVADALGVRGVAVVEILSEADWRMHRLTPFARVDGTTITYPPAQERLI